MSPLETVCMKCQNLFSGKNKKNISIFRRLKILPRVYVLFVYLYVLDDFMTLYFSVCMFAHSYMEKISKQT